MRILLLTLMVLAGRAWSVDAYFSGNDLMSYCEADTIASKNICTAYVAAISDDISINRVIFPRASSDGYFAFNDVCLPDGAGSIQLEKVWTKWANEQPEELHLAAAGLVTEAFAKAFPCQ